MVAFMLIVFTGSDENITLELRFVHSFISI